MSKVAIYKLVTMVVSIQDSSCVIAPRDIEMTEISEQAASDMLASASATVAPEQIQSNERHIFLAALAIATVFPIFFNVFFDQADNKPVEKVFGLLLIISSMHVALTGFFFFDRDYRLHMNEHWKYFYAFPISLIILFGLITNSFGKTGQAYVMVGYHAWLLWHYGRQNLGILSFVSRLTNSTSVNSTERLILNASAVGGILGAYGVLANFDKTMFGQFEEQIVMVGQIVFLAAILAGFAHAFRLYLNKEPAIRVLFSCALPLFYAPTFLFEGYFEAVVGYAIAHACQYFIFMYYLAAGDKNRSRSNVLALVAIAIVGWTIILITGDASIWGGVSGFIPGIAIGIVTWHFIIDAGVWRLSHSWQRSQISKRFEFL